MKNVQDMIRERQILNNEMNENVNDFAERMKNGLRDEIITSIKTEKEELDKAKEKQEKKAKRESGFLGKVKKIIKKIAASCNEVPEN